MHGVPPEFYIVYNGIPILGRDLFTAFNLKIVNGHIDLSQNSSTTFQTTVSAVTQDDDEKLGCALGFVHKVKMQHTLIPVQ